MKAAAAVGFGETPDLLGLALGSGTLGDSLDKPKKIEYSPT